MSPKKEAPTSSSQAKTKSTKKTVEKRAIKAEVSARKNAAKTQVRMTRVKLRSAKKAAPSKEGSRMKDKVVGHAPHSARISDPKGNVKPLASRTRFLPKTDENRNWLVIDAKNYVVGRLASEIAKILRGKHKPSFTPNNDNGDFVVVINAEKIKFSSNKEQTKEYYKYSGYIGGLKTRTAEQLRNTYPERIIESAVKGMVPRTPLGRAQMRKLKVYSGEKHPHSAQNPVLWTPKGVKSIEA